MAKITYNVTDKVAEAFDELYDGRDKGAVLAALMERAVNDERRRRRRAEAMDDLLSRRDERPEVTPEILRKAIEELREWP